MSNGLQTVTPTSTTARPNLATVLRWVDHEEDRLGVTYTAAPIKRARAARDAAAELRRALSTHTADHDARAAAHGREYLAGAVTADDLVTAAATLAPLTAKETAGAARRYLERAAAAVDAEGVAALQEMTEDAWQKPLRTVTAERVAAAHEAAEALDLDPGQAAPARTDLRDNITMRHRWELLAEALERLADVYALPDHLRSVGLLPLVPGRTVREAYRWLHPSRLQGTPADPRPFWLLNRGTAEPGLFTAQEMREADRGPGDHDEHEDELTTTGAKRPVW